MAENTLRPALDAVQQANAGMDEGAWFVPLIDRSVFEAKGRHRARFLHNFTTCQVKELTERQVRWGAVTSGQGGVVGMALIHAEPESIGVEVAVDLRDEIITHLTKYRIADQVTFEPRDDVVIVSVLGDQAPALLATVGLDWPTGNLGQYEEVPWRDTVVRVLANDFRWGTANVDIGTTKPQLDALVVALEAAGFKAADSGRQDAHRVAHGVPRERSDVDTDTTPLEAAHLRPTVDWNKGCYLGQEVICMMEDLGKPRKMLMEVSAEGPAPAHGTELLNDKDKTVGWIGTSTSVDGIAYALATVKRKHAKPGITLRTQGGAVLTVQRIAGQGAATAE